MAGKRKAMKRSSSTRKGKGVGGVKGAVKSGTPSTKGRTDRGPGFGPVEQS